MHKVLLLGIDALDRELIQRFAPILPHITAVQCDGVSLPVRSTFPPDSDTAWATIVTGLNPAEHGIVRFVDPLEKSYQILHGQSPNAVLQGRTFWDLASRAGRRAIAVFPHLCHPVWRTESLMVSRGSSVAEVQATDPDVLHLYPDPAVLTGVRGLPDGSVKGLSAYRDRLYRQAEADAEFALRLLRQNDWDMFFVYWSTIDAIGHFFWNYFDSDDPLYQPGHPFEQAIPDTYQIFDTIIGRFLSAIDDETTVIVLSDHGHGGRPSKLIAINEILRRAGFLVARNTKTNPHVAVVERAKRLAVGCVGRYGLARPAARVMRHCPGAMHPFTRPLSIDWRRTTAYATDLSGIKAYPYGGLRINKDALGTQDYDSVRLGIINLLQQECVFNGQNLVRFIARREDVYNGPYIDQYPDIVLELVPQYGVGWQINAGLVTQPTTRQIVPGSHRGDTGTFLMRGGPELGIGEIDLLDISSLMLDLLGVTPPGTTPRRTVVAKQFSA